MVVVVDNLFDNFVVVDIELVVVDIKAVDIEVVDIKAVFELGLDCCSNPNPMKRYQQHLM